MYSRANDWATRMVGKLTPEQTRRIAERVLDTVDTVSNDRWQAAVERADRVPGQLRPDRIRALTRSFTRELGVAGAAAGAAAAAPGVGTLATFAATMTELTWFTSRAGDLILTIAALHGRPEPTVDERRAWVLAVLIYGSSARSGMSRAINEASVGVAPPTQRGLPLATLQAANQIMGRALLRRYGTRRGLIAVGRLLPIGVGAALGGSANYLAVRSLARNADQFFQRLPYSAIDADSVDLSGRELR